MAKIEILVMVIKMRGQSKTQHESQLKWIEELEKTPLDATKSRNRVISPMQCCVYMSELGCGILNVGSGPTIGQAHLTKLRTKK